MLKEFVDRVQNNFLIDFLRVQHIEPKIKQYDISRPKTFFHGKIQSWNQIFVWNIYKYILWNVCLRHKYCAYLIKFRNVEVRIWKILSFEFIHIGFQIRIFSFPVVKTSQVFNCWILIECQLEDNTNTLEFHNFTQVIL